MKKNFLTITLAALFSLAGTASASTIDTTTTTLSSSFDSWLVQVGPQIYFHGSIFGQSTMTQTLSTQSWLDWLGQSAPWYSSSTFTDLQDTTTSEIGVLVDGDNTSNFGYDSTSTYSQIHDKYSYSSSTFYPLEDRLHIDAEEYQTLNLISSSTFYTWDCRDLVNAGLSGGCAGSRLWSTTTNSQMIGGTWVDFDIIGGLLENFQSGPFTPGSYTYTDGGFNSWGIQPSVVSGGSPTPEPFSFGLIGMGLVALGGFRASRKTAR